ncbi:hypothetical protein [Stackebrandtia nassauensis]|uniref:Uncharacterized protein n=1 Tax=Stackebrandtia nassauensis (strain DSM 44728 / CIP 108903 / NRRL B-16338 / NBRC 102104 / LLR-40K-21) TaxID=446470 RepID=D3Q6U8_STANL|nr:hypothetical protein [Stackebrandtia nassauensis]ADD40347.1 hypothetical protein Snas_0633 [Stackebrandtia nassauensis DSM 44728]
MMEKQAFEMPVFGGDLVRTQRRRFTTPDGTNAGWLIVNAADQFTEIFDDVAAALASATDLSLDALAVHDDLRASLPHQLRRVPGACCPVPGCTHHHGDLGDNSDDPPQHAVPQQR